MKRTASVVLMTVILVSCGGSSRSPTGPGNPGSGGPAIGVSTLTATIDGVPWTATGGTGGGFNNQILSVTGLDSRQTLLFGLNMNRGLGTYVMTDTDPSAINALLALTPSGMAWQAFGSFGSGTVTITTLTSTNAVGTFSFTLRGVPGTGATGTKSIVGGTFNVALTGQPPVPPSIVNGTISALVDGNAWRGASLARAFTVGPVLSVAGQDTDGRALTMAIVATGPGTYSLNHPNASNAVMTLGGQQWFTAFVGGLGTVTITQFTSTRVAGTFALTLQPSTVNMNPRAVDVTNGQFDIALQSGAASR